MAETSIQKARRLAREKREAREAAEAAAAAAAAKAPAAKEPESPGFFASFFGRAETVDEAVAAAQREAQTTDSNN